MAQRQRRTVAGSAEWTALSVITLGDLAVIRGLRQRSRRYARPTRVLLSYLALSLNLCARNPVGLLILLPYSIRFLEQAKHVVHTRIDSHGNITFD